MRKKQKTHLMSNETEAVISFDNNDTILIDEISGLIERSRRTIYSQASITTIFLFWEIGKCVNGDVLENKRADYGKKIV